MRLGRRAKPATKVEKPKKNTAALEAEEEAREAEPLEVQRYRYHSNRPHLMAANPQNV